MDSLGSLALGLAAKTAPAGSTTLCPDGTEPDKEYQLSAKILWPIYAVLLGFCCLALFVRWWAARSADLCFRRSHAAFLFLVMVMATMRIIDLTHQRCDEQKIVQQGKNLWFYNFVGTAPMICSFTLFTLLIYHLSLVLRTVHLTYEVAFKSTFEPDSVWRHDSSGTMPAPRRTACHKFTCLNTFNYWFVMCGRPRSSLGFGLTILNVTIWLLYIGAFILDAWRGASSVDFEVFCYMIVIPSIIAGIVLAMAFMFSAVVLTLRLRELRRVMLMAAQMSFRSRTSGSAAVPAASAAAASGQPVVASILSAAGSTTQGAGGLGMSSFVGTSQPTDIRAPAAERKSWVLNAGDPEEADAKNPESRRSSWHANAKEISEKVQEEPRLSTTSTAHDGQGGTAGSTAHQSTLIRDYSSCGRVSYDRHSTASSLANGMFGSRSVARRMTSSSDNQAFLLSGSEALSAGAAGSSAGGISEHGQLEDDVAELPTVQAGHSSSLVGVVQPARGNSSPRLSAYVGSAPAASSFLSGVHMAAPRWGRSYEASASPMTTFAEGARLSLPAVEPVLSGLRRMQAVISICVLAFVVRASCLVYVAVGRPPGKQLTWPDGLFLPYMIISEVLPYFVLLLLYLIPGVHALCSIRSMSRATSAPVSSVTLVSSRSHAQVMTSVLESVLPN
eukprot:TRINITY_DN17028_c0_g1_i1.p1 TRINITY_DN17028_c0_g1~~TRINITY_DN17028_c0_g1_i1.p1  ORF type:complete len:672 (-),score=109.33 TRINITY_DN17028_c0_g1_i1:264-2279(-)